MNKTLPFEMPLIDTYQGSSFVQGIILAYPNLVNSLMHTYINLACKDTNNIHDMLLQFTNSLWGDFDREGALVTKNYNIIEILKIGRITDFIKEKIDLGNYLALYQIDDYYLSYTAKYLKRHFMHDTYILGYKDDDFLVMAYTHKKLKVFYVPMSEIEDGLISASRITEKADFAIIEAKPNQIDLDVKHIIREFEDYYYSKVPVANSESLIYGEQIYDILFRCLKTLKEQSGDEAYSIDLRTMKVLWEHKKMMVRNVQILGEKFRIDSELIEALAQLEKNARTIWNLSIMCKFKRDSNTVERIVILVENMRKKEKEIIRSLLLQFYSWDNTDF